MTRSPVLGLRRALAASSKRQMDALEQIAIAKALVKMRQAKQFEAIFVDAGVPAIRCIVSRTRYGSSIRSSRTPKRRRWWTFGAGWNHIDEYSRPTVEVPSSCLSA